MRHLSLKYITLVVAMCASALLSLSIGPRQDVFLTDLVSALTSDELSINQSIIFDLRLPRTFVAILVGANLGLAGMILQAITRNPLASPSILGINQGAALGMTLGLVFPGIILLNLDFMAILGALIAGALTFSFANSAKSGFNSLRLILAGIAVGAFSFAMVRFTFILDDDLAREVIGWTSGNISASNWQDVKPLMVWTFLGIVSSYLLAHKFNLLALGEAASQGLGANPKLIQFMGAVIAATLTAITVAVAGPVMFVGLVIPHFCRRFFGQDHRLLLPATMLAGALLMSLADIVAKLINFPYETPTGIICALIGAPYFLYQSLTVRGAKL